MAFIDVDDRRLYAHGFQRAYAAYAQNYFLPYAHFAVAAVQLPGYFPVFGCIFINVRIKQKQRYAPHLYFPDARINCAFIKLNGHFKHFAVAILYALHRHTEKMIFHVFFLLPAVKVKVLLEISETV